MRRRHPLPKTPVPASVVSLTHEGRGVARIDGKTVFIDGALPGEQVTFRYVGQHRNFDEGEVCEILTPSADRVAPRCEHFAICGGCSLQHLSSEGQARAKQQVLIDNLQHIGKVTPQTVLEPLVAEPWGYRRKARLGVKYVIKKGRALVGFRERRSPYLAQLDRCHVLHPSVGERLTELAELIGSLEAREKIPQIEVAVSDEATALVFRHLADLSTRDSELLTRYAQERGFQLYVQSGGPDTVRLLWPQEAMLSYRLPDFNAELHFRPTDFFQINSAINRKMVPLALRLLDPQPHEQVLDLFCGLGNFTLPLARLCGQVVGVEGEAGLVQRARENAQRNGIVNAQFHSANLMADVTGLPWLRGSYDKVLLDPPRSGAIEMLPHLARLGARRLVYVSCNPATLARDAGELVHQHGYHLVSAGIMDMFPHTAHVESIALFERRT